MKKKKKKNHPSYLGFGVASVLFLSGLTGCGSSTGSSGAGGGDTTVPGLAVADQMSLVTASDDGASASVSALSHVFRSRWIVPTTGDYIADPVTTYVYDESMSALDMVNEILCYFSQTRYEEMVNEGNYLAMVDSSLCKAGQDQSAAAGSQSDAAENQRSFEEWIVNSSRASSTSEQIVRAWVPQDASSGDPADEIRVQMTITEGASSVYPFGIFYMAFQMLTDGEEIGNGALQASVNDEGNTVLQMVIGTEDGSMDQQIHAIITPDGTTGQAYVYSQHSGGEVSSGGGGAGLVIKHDVDPSAVTQIAFNEEHYASSDASGERCLDRQNFDEVVWSYNLYGEDGSRTELNSGMPARFGDYHIWAGSYGVYADSAAGLENGDTVTSDDGETSYTYFEGAGRFSRWTRHTLTLNDFEDDVFEWYDPETFSNYQIQWTGTVFQKIREMSCGDGGCQFTDLESPETLSLSDGDTLYLYKDGLGNLNIYVDGSLSNSTEVPYFVQETILPGDELLASGDLTFKCYNNCIRGGLTQEQVDDNDFYLADAPDVDSPHLYVLDSETLELTQDGHPVSVAGLDLSSSFYSWGLVVSNLIPSTTDITDMSEVYSQVISYSYETGDNDYSHTTALLDSEGDALAFDAPLSCLYESEDEGTYLLNYQGPGLLFGIPWEELENEETGYTRWVPSIRLPDGTPVTCGEDTYYVRATTVEQSMQSLDSAACSGMLTTSVDAPTVAYTAHGMGARPSVTGAAAVVAGEVQE